MILYCRRHDLAYCEKHGENPCFSKSCILHQEPRATFCCICSGLRKPDESKPNESSESPDNAAVQGKTT